MHECCYFSRSPEILVNIQFVFENLLIFLCKQMHLAFVLWFKKHRRCWPNFTAFVEKAQPRVATSMFGYLFDKRRANDARL